MSRDSSNYYEDGADQRVPTGALGLGLGRGRITPKLDDDVEVSEMADVLL
jgi:hypothetical protein